MSWDQSKAQGKAAELRLYDWLRLTYPQTRILNGFDKVDLEIPELSCLGVEVKWDDVSTRTGKIAFEKSCAGHPSGISSTTADVWVIFSGGDILAMRIKHLRVFLAETQPEVKAGGDRAATLMYLVPKQTLMAQPFVFEIDLSRPPIPKAA